MIQTYNKKLMGIVAFLMGLAAWTYFMGTTESVVIAVSTQGISDGFLLDLATNLRISERTAYAVIDVILVTSDVLTAISLIVAIIGGVGLITAGMVQTDKYLAMKKGKEYAAK